VKKNVSQIVDRGAKGASLSLEQFARANGQFLLPMVELITSARLAVDELIGEMGRKTIETILLLSAAEVAGERTPGKPSGEIRWHGSQAGRVKLAEPASEGEAPAFAA
jgi:hypothetical protein